MFSRKAFSMIEVMCAICIFALAVLPLIWLSSSQTKTAYSASKHLMAGQLAASYMDNFLKRPYDKLKNLSNLRKQEILNLHEDGKDYFDLENLIVNGLESDTAKENMKTSFKNFKCEFTFDTQKDSVSKLEYIKITVKVFYQAVEGNKDSEQTVELNAIKFGDKNG